MVSRATAEAKTAKRGPRKVWMIAWYWHQPSFSASLQIGCFAFFASPVNNGVGQLEEHVYRGLEDVVHLDKI